jgi:hypothetical protein
MGTVAKRRQLAGWGGIGLVVALLAACATTTGQLYVTEQSPPEVKKEVVTARANARWQALLRGDLTAAYEYLSPGSKAAMSLDFYKGKHRTGMYRAATIESVACVANACTVNINVTYDYKTTKGIVTPLSERWVISGGRAWYVEGG